GKPIQCWIPQEFTRGWEEYAENYCWVSNTYFSPLPKRLPQSMADRENARILYYQWAPILMAIQALLFYLPCLIWRLFNSHSGFNVRRIMQMANDSNILLPEHGLKNVRFIARYMEGCIYRLRDYKRVSSTGAGSAGISSTFPYRGMQRFPLETELPPPGYTKADLEARRGGGDKRSNGEPNLGVASARRHKRTTRSLCDCNRGGLGSCWGSRSSRRRSRKFPLNPITESSPATGLASPTERAEMARRGGKSTPRGYNCCGRRSGNFLVVLYFFVKGLYLINIVGQLILMEKFIGTNTAFYGVRVLIDLLQGNDWHTSGNFPRVTFCDFEAKKLGKNQL
ncbi:Innexin unc-9, partial [Taenia solium]